MSLETTSSVMTKPLAKDLLPDVVRFLINGEPYDILMSTLQKWPDTMFAVAAEFSINNLSDTNKITAIPVVHLSGDLKCYRILLMYLQTGELIFPKDDVDRELLMTVAGQCCMPLVVAQLSAKMNISTVPLSNVSVGNVAVANVSVGNSLDGKADCNAISIDNKTGQVQINVNDLVNNESHTSSITKSISEKWNFWKPTAVSPSSSVAPFATSPTKINSSSESTLWTTIKNNDIKFQTEEYTARLKFGQDQDGTSNVNVHALFETGKTQLPLSTVIGADLLYDSLIFPGLNAKADRPSKMVYVQSLQEFQEQFDVFTLGLSKAWESLPLVAAGGSVLAALHRFPMHNVSNEALTAHHNLCSEAKFDRCATPQNSIALQNSIVFEIHNSKYWEFAYAVFKHFEFNEPLRRRFRRMPWHVQDDDETNARNRMQLEIAQLKSIVDQLQTHLGDSSTKKETDVNRQADLQRSADVTPNLKGNINSNVAASQHHLRLLRCLAINCLTIKSDGKLENATGNYPAGSDGIQKRYRYLPIHDQNWTLNLPDDNGDVENNSTNVENNSANVENNSANVRNINLNVANNNVSGTAHDARQILQSFSQTDIDLFLVTRSPETAIKTIIELDKRIRDLTLPDLRNDIHVMRTEHATTWCMPKPYRNIQVIHRLYYSIEHILLGFDLDCCCMAHDGKRVLALDRGMRSLQYRYNLVDLTRQSTTYESRLVKYAERGFAIAVPQLDFEAEIKLLSPKLNRLLMSTTSIAFMLSEMTGLQVLLTRLYLIHNKHAHCELRKFLRIRASDYSSITNDKLTHVQMKQRIRTAQRNQTLLPFVYGKNLMEVLTTNKCSVQHFARRLECESSLPVTVSFQLQRPHAQDRVDLFYTGSFHPVALEWYGARVATALKHSV